MLRSASQAVKKQSLHHTAPPRTQIKIIARRALRLISQQGEEEEKKRMVISIRNLGLLLFFGLLLLLPYRITLSGDMQGKRKTGSPQSSFDPFGIYSVIGSKSDAFDDFYNFQIDLLKKPVKGRPLVMAGHAQFGKDGRIYAELINLKLTLAGTTLSFATEEVEGISYVFEGQFLRKDNFSKLRRGTPVLEGILLKKVKGKEVAKENLKFMYITPD
jgi:hypothetical protein